MAYISGNNKIYKVIKVYLNKTEWVEKLEVDCPECKKTYVQDIGPLKCPTCGELPIIK